MTSGEILFILAFIVLPTAILVSSVWAVIFVRRRPDRAAYHPADETVSRADTRRPDLEDTAVLAAVGRQSADQAAVEDHPSAEAEDVVDEPEDLEWHEPEPAQADTLLPIADAGIAVPEDQAPVGPDADQMQPEPLAMQHTDELGDVVAALAEQDEEEKTEPSPDSLDDESDEPVAVDDEAEESEPDFVETSELPVITPADEPEPHVESAERRDDAETSRYSSRQRRKGSVKLRPGDPEAPKQRGRKGDPARYVPQLSRSFRRRDDTAAGTPPESDPDQSSPPGRE